MSKDKKLKKLSILKIGSLPPSNQNVPVIRQPVNGTSNEVTPFASRPLKNPNPSLRMKMEQLSEACGKFESK